MELFEINAGSFIGVASTTPLGQRKLIKAIDAGSVTFNYTELIRNTNENIGTGDGIIVDFTVSKPPILYENELVVYVDGIVATNYTFVASTGVITFSAPVASGSIVTADYFSEDAIAKVVSMTAGEVIYIGGNCNSVTSTAAQNVILS